MPHLALSCFGPFQVMLDGEQMTRFHSVKVEALLAYLAVEANQPHRRASLATLLWPLDAEASARNSLRQALYDLRKLLGDSDNRENPFLLVTRRTVQFNPEAEYTLDVTDFLDCIERNEPARAAALYRGDLLAGLPCESEPFEEWLRLTRQRYHNLAVDLLMQLTAQALGTGDYAQAKHRAQQQLALEPWREEAHRQLMTALALAGERSAALAQYETCRRTLAAELGVAPDEETTALYEQIKMGKLRGQRSDPLPAAPIGPPPSGPRLGEEQIVQPATPQTVRHNLPPQPTPFIGRQNDLAQIAARLADPACRLLTVVGPGGMGKTRLALQAAQAILDFGFGIWDLAVPGDNPKSKLQTPKFEGGVFFVALAGVGSPDLLVSTIAAALDFTFYGSADPKTQLLDHLRSRSMLLVLDNFEHLLDGAELVSEILGASPASKVLATSREPLNLREEWLHPLTGMSFPVDDTQAAPLKSYTAVQFFVQCARQLKPGFDLAAEAAAVVRICRLVDGMPLGIELAATWLKFFSCAQIAGEVEQSFEFLATSLRNVPDRHRNMRAVFEHSWGLLTEAEQMVLQRLAIFRGGFDRTGAQQVAGATISLLASLADKSLIQVARGERYQIHELLRQFASEKLHSDPAEAERVQDEHCHYYLAFLAHQESRLKGPEHLTAIQAIEREVENVRAAWGRAVASEKLEELDQSLESLYVFHDAKCWFEQGLALFQQASALLRARQVTAGRESVVLAKVLDKQAVLRMHLSGEGGATVSFAEAQTLLEQCKALLHPMMNLRSLARC